METKVLQAGKFSLVALGPETNFSIWSEDVDRVTVSIDDDGHYLITLSGLHCKTIVNAEWGKDDTDRRDSGG